MGQIFSRISAQKTFNIDVQYRALEASRQRYIECAQEILNKMEALRARQEELSELNSESVTELPIEERPLYQVTYQITSTDDDDDFNCDVDAMDCCGDD